MNTIIKSLLLLSGELKEVKVHMELLHKTRVEHFKEAWVDGADAMEILKMSRRTLSKLRNSGELPFSQINGKLYYKLADIETLLEANYKSKNGDHEAK